MGPSVNWLLTNLTLLLLALGIGTGSASAALPTRAQISGNWIATNGITACPHSVPANFTGCLFRMAWKTMQQDCQSPPHYDFSKLEASLSRAKAAGYYVAIAVYTGVYAPDCVLSAPGVNTFSSIWDRDSPPGRVVQKGVNIEACSTYVVADPRNAAYQAWYARFYNAMAADVAARPGHTQLVRVVSSGAVMHSDETALPYYDANTAASRLITCNQDNGCGCGFKGCTCHPNNDTSNWLLQTPVYSRTSVEAAISTLLRDTATAFPNQVIDIMGATDFPPTDNNGVPCPYGVFRSGVCGTAGSPGTRNKDYRLRVDIHTNGRKSLGAQYVAQHNGWTQTFVDPVLPTIIEGKGMQAAKTFANTAHLCAALRLLWSKHYWWEESFTRDAKDPANQACYAWFETVSRLSNMPEGAPVSP
jgi:hypothetical protein